MFGLDMRDQRSIRVILQQSDLPQYRVPVFTALSRRPNISLLVQYGNINEVRNADPGELDAEPTQIYAWAVPRGRVFWAPTHWRSADKAVCDVLLLPWNTRYLSLAPALLKARRRGVATILWGHGHSKRDSRMRMWLRRTIGRLATAVVFYDSGAARSFVESGMNPAATFVAPNTLDQAPIQAAMRSWSADPESLNKFRARHHLDQGPVVLFVSRLHPRNRLDLLFGAMVVLADEYPDLKAVVVGDGTDEKQRLLALVKELGLGDKVRFEDAIFDEDELAPWFMSANVLVYPAMVGLTAIHAFGYGVPVVANSSPTANGPEWAAIRHGENGLLFSDGESGELADALRTIFADAALRERMSNEAMRTVQRQYSLEAMVRGFEEAIRHGASQTREPTPRPEPGSSEGDGD